MRLKILHTESSEGWGGQEIRILDESAGFIARGHAVELAACPDSNITRAARERGIPVHEVPIAKRSRAGLKALARVIDALEPDVIVTHSSSDSWLVALTTLFRSAPAIVRTRHLGLHVSGGLANRWLYGRVPKKVVTTGEATRQMLIERVRLDPDRVISIPTGIDLARYCPGDGATACARLGLPNDKPIVGIVATLRSGKGHRFLIEAMKDPRLGEVRLVIVGDGPQEVVLPGIAQECGVADRVIFAGRQQNVGDWLKAFDIFALPSIAIEGAPQAVMQAMASALPVVATPVGAIPEVVSGDETGLFVKPSDADSLADAIAQLVENPERARAFGAAGRMAAERKFGIGTMLQAMERVLQDAAKPR